MVRQVAVLVATVVVLGLAAAGILPGAVVAKLCESSWNSAAALPR